MSSNNNVPISYSSIAKKNLPSQAPHQQQQTNPSPPIRKIASSQPPTTHPQHQQQPQHLFQHTPSPTHIPRTSSPSETVYILTLLTSPAQHARLTALRTQYFPARINKLAAHLTLFHALPASKLTTSIIPAIESLAKQTAPFDVHATNAFRLKKGIAIAISSEKGGRQGQAIHRELQGQWREEGFLSEQDEGGCRLHYTIMNKVDDEAVVAQALGEVKESFGGDEGVAEGLALWRYDRGFWRGERRFLFEGRE